ncbi:MAG: protein kinase, partial [Cyanobacteria bacterium P01_A01_bin.83]
MLNQLLVGRYLVKEVLGEGGLAKTYIAIDQHKPSRPQCVVKILKPASKDSSFLHIARRLFNTEAQILDKLGKHGQIPQLLAYFEENKEFFIIQEYIAGHTLSTELPTGHRWTENKVILMLQDVLKTLAFVHDSRVIHRDLKPSNLIRRDKDGKIVLIDFGAVKQVGDTRITTKMPLTPKTISIGTQGYMPLEQARGKPKFNSDIYSLGMTAIQALTGTDPFHLAEGADGEVIWRNYAKVSDPLAAILNQMVRYNFTNRYQSVSEVQQALATLDHPVVLQVTSGDKQQGGSSSESELRETRVSLENKLLEIETFDTAVSELETALEDIVPPRTPVEPKETKVSLSNSENLEQVNIPEARIAKKPRTRDSWSTWDLDTSPSVKPHNTSTKTDQIDSREADLETKAKKQNKNDSWNLLNSAPVAKPKQDLADKPVKNKQVDQTAAVQVNSEESKTIQDTAPQKAPVNPTPESKETRISLGNKPRDASSLVNIKQTRLSLSNEQDNSHSASEVAPKETKISEGNYKFTIAFSATDGNETKASIDRKIKVIPLNIAKDKINNLNLSTLAIISLPIKKIKLDQIAIAISQAASSISKHLLKIKPSLVLTKNNKYVLLIGSGVSLTAIAFYFGSKHFTYQQKYSEAKITLQEIKTLKTTKKYQECIQQAHAATDNLANFNIDTALLVQDCSQGQLNAAKKLAKESRYKDAINLATAIPTEQDIYAESQELITQWSNKIYQIATNKYNEGNLEQAIAIL